MRARRIRLRRIFARLSFARRATSRMPTSTRPFARRATSPIPAQQPSPRSRPARLDYHRPRPPRPQPAAPLPLRHALLPALAFTALLWLIHLSAVFILPAAEASGIYPRRADGLPGILLAPLLHASFEHLIANTFPLLVLGGGMIYFYPKAAKIALPFLYLVPGIGVWLFARGAWHLGASGLSYGMMFFVLVTGFLRKDRVAAGFSMAVLFLYGGMLLGLLPDDSGVSFEYHLFGALSGVLCAFALRARDPIPPPPAPHEVAEEEEEDDPVIGDQWRLPR